MGNIVKDFKKKSKNDWKENENNTIIFNNNIIIFQTMKVILKNLRFPFTHYKTLNLQPNATAEQIKKQYLFLAK